MPITLRERFIEGQLQELNEKFGLTDGEERERERFFRMAVETYELFAQSHRYVSPFKINPESAFNFINSREKKERAGIPPALMERWRQWRDDYPGLLKRNPKLEMHDMMVAIGESDSAMGWPFQEEQIQDWLDSGNRFPLPFADRYDIATEEFYHKFRYLRQCVGGWLHSGDRGIVFSPEAEWQALRSANKAAQRERTNWLEEEQAKKARRERRLTEIFEEARAEKTLWQQLIECELAFEKVAPTPDGIIPGLIVVGRREGDVRPRPDREPLMRFVSGLNKRADGIPDRDIAVHILINLRKSIGLNHTIITL
jgi:hypothetical protein